MGIISWIVKKMEESCEKRSKNICSVCGEEKVRVMGSYYSCGCNRDNDRED